MYQKPDPDKFMFLKDPSIAVEQEIEARRQLARDVHLKEQDFKDHGYTAVNCARCG